MRARSPDDDRGLTDPYPSHPVPRDRPLRPKPAVSLLLEPRERPERGSTMRLVLELDDRTLASAVGAHATHEHDQPAEGGSLQFAEGGAEDEGPGRQAHRHG